MKRKLNKIKVSIAIILIVLAFTIAVFGRYIYNSVREAYFASQQFYFTSNILTVNGSNYQYSNWGGQDVYAIKFDLYSYESSTSKMADDLNYTVTCSTSDSDKIKVSVGSYGDTAQTTLDGTIPKDTNLSPVTIYVTPIGKIEKNDKVTINVTAKSIAPYQKTLSCEFTLIAGTEGTNTYSIEDVTNRDYAILSLTAPTAETKVTLEFDPTELRIDTNDEVYLNASEVGTVVSETDNNTYVNKIVYTIPAETTKYVKFYKVDKSQNYTYPGVEDECAIKVTM